MHGQWQVLLCTLLCWILVGVCKVDSIISRWQVSLWLLRAVFTCSRAHSQGEAWPALSPRLSEIPHYSSPAHLTLPSGWTAFPPIWAEMHMGHFTLDPSPRKCYNNETTKSAMPRLDLRMNPVAFLSHPSADGTFQDGTLRPEAIKLLTDVRP